jgi:hypothetical protein
VHCCTTTTTTTTIPSTRAETPTIDWAKNVKAPAPFILMRPTG